MKYYKKNLITGIILILSALSCFEDYEGSIADANYYQRSAGEIYNLNASKVGESILLVCNYDGQILDNFVEVSRSEAYSGPYNIITCSMSGIGNLLNFTDTYLLTSGHTYYYKLRVILPSVSNYTDIVSATY